jgi:NADH-quinone oxidoreductase subunit M
MLSYGVVSGAMLLCTGMLYDRTKTASIAEYGGVANTMPRFAAFVMLFSMANIGLPGTSGFVGEFMVLMGAIRFNFWIGAIAASTLVLSAAYTLWMYKRVIFGAIANAILSAWRNGAAGAGDWSLPEAVHGCDRSVGRHVAGSVGALGASGRCASRRWRASAGSGACAGGCHGGSHTGLIERGASQLQDPRARIQHCGRALSHRQSLFTMHAARRDLVRLGRVLAFIQGDFAMRQVFDAWQ